MVLRKLLALQGHGVLGHVSFAIDPTFGRSELGELRIDRPPSDPGFFSAEKHSRAFAGIRVKSKSRDRKMRLL